MYIVLQIQLQCTYASNFIYLDVLYLKCLIISLISANNSFKLIVSLFAYYKKNQNESQRIMFFLLTTNI
jgi:hypothetical protein